MKNKTLWILIGLLLVLLIVFVKRTPEEKIIEEWKLPRTDGKIDPSLGYKMFHGIWTRCGDLEYNNIVSVEVTLTHKNGSTINYDWVVDRLEHRKLPWNSTPPLPLCYQYG